MKMNLIVQKITERIIERSRNSREQYLSFIEQQAKIKQQRPARFNLGCTNLAHDIAAADDADKLILKQNHRAANIAIISAYNDVLSAHQPYQFYPQQIKEHLAALGHVGQMAGGVPAMCDGVTQGHDGMELSLFSRDTIALSTAVALSHDVFDGIVLLGICDKIVPGLLMAALRFGHLPAVFLPSGPMASGISNDEKAKVRQQFAKGDVTEKELLESESASYHSAGTCTFYGTANSNQMMMEIMGLQLPGSSFLSPNHDLRDPLNKEALNQLVTKTDLENAYMPVGQMLDEKSLVNAIVGLLATGGSTNHTIHLIAIAKMMGVILEWQDFSDLSEVVPLLTKIYPNGKGDINQFQQAGGMSFLIRELLSEGLLHEDVMTILGRGLSLYTKAPDLVIQNHSLQWLPAVSESRDLNILAPAHAPFAREGGIKVLHGNLGQAVIKTSAMPKDRWSITAPAKVFEDQKDVIEAYNQQQLNQDVIVVVKHQGPKANGMPELHKLTPLLTNLQEQGYQVALVTDGRLSGASGKVPAAIHVCPEALDGGVIGQIKNGDNITLDVHAGSLTVDQEYTEMTGKGVAENQSGSIGASFGVGRELFSNFRKQVTPANKGAISIDF